MAEVTTGKADIPSLIATSWSPIIYQELRAKVAFLNLFARDYEGSIKAIGDTVKVNTINAPVGEILANDKTAFSSELMSVSTFSVTANKRASAAFKVTNMASLQSLSFIQDAQEALRYSLMAQMEADILAALVPSAAAPDHQIAPAVPGTLAAADVNSLRTLLSIAKVPGNNRYLALSPSYYGDLLNTNSLMSKDFSNSNDQDNGQVVKALGFNIFEHDILGNDLGYAFHPSALQLVMQTGVEVKFSDLHANHEYAGLISANIIYGFTLADDKRIAKIAA